MSGADLEMAERVNAEWSAANRLLLEAARADRAWLEDESFASLHRENPLQLFNLQAWPFFASPAKLREVARVTVGMDRLLRGVLERLLGNDPRRINEIYQVGSEDLVALMLAEPNGIGGAVSRSDYLDTPGGLVCLEYNAGSQIGGWQSQLLAPPYIRCPLIAGFLEENGIRARPRNTIQALFRHLVQDTVRQGVWERGSFQLAIVIQPNDPLENTVHHPDLYEAELREALAAVAPGANGSVRLCGYDDMDLAGARPALGEEPVHAVLEQQAGLVDRRIFRLFKAGRVSLYSGLVTRLLSDKRGLAVLSESAASGALTPVERELVERHLPWTRRLLRAEAVRQGCQVFLPEHVLRRREELVIKKALSMSGKDVHLGCFCSPDRWRELVGRALADGDWIVQDLVAGRPYAFKAREGVAPHRVVWGLFAFGGELGGAFVRLQPWDRQTPVNTYSGAEVGVLLETEEVV